MKDRKEYLKNWKKIKFKDNPNYWKEYYREHRDLRTLAKRLDYQKNPFKYIVMGAKKRAKASGLEYDLDTEWIVQRWTGRCELTGIEFKIGDGKSNPYSCSIDRINPAKGYTKDNCRFILFGINALKGTGNDADVFMIASALLDNNKKKEE